MKKKYYNLLITNNDATSYSPRFHCCSRPAGCPLDGLLVMRTAFFLSGPLKWPRTTCSDRCTGHDDRNHNYYLNDVARLLQSSDVFEKDR